MSPACLSLRCWGSVHRCPWWAASSAGGEDVDAPTHAGIPALAGPAARYSRHSQQHVWRPPNKWHACNLSHLACQAINSTQVYPATVNQPSVDKKATFGTLRLHRESSLGPLGRQSTGTGSHCLARLVFIRRWNFTFYRHEARTGGIESDTWWKDVRIIGTSFLQRARRRGLL